MDASTNVAASVRQLRQVRGFTQQKLGTLSGVPRATIATLESGSANPTLAVLVKVSAALGVTIEELVSPPRASARLVRVSELEAEQRGRVLVRQLLPETIPGVVVERMELAPGARMTGTPHKPGTREYLACERGGVQLVASGEVYDLEDGDVVVFRGDQRHGYFNRGDRTSVAYSVVLPAGR
jgi:XRE family transcriptional regulator, regulator of sulfur utilization